MLLRHGARKKDGKEHRDWSLMENWRLRAFLKNGMGPGTRDFGRGRGGETGASPSLACGMTVEPTKASPKRPVARRVLTKGIAQQTFFYYT